MPPAEMGTGICSQEHPRHTRLFVHLQPISCSATQTDNNGLTFLLIFCLFVQGVTLVFIKTNSFSLCSQLFLLPSTATVWR